MRHLLQFALLAGASLAIHCFQLIDPARAAELLTKGAAMATDQNAFFSVPLNTRVANACSPTAPDANWHGVLISAPQVVRLARGPGQAVAPICGLYRIELPRLLDDVPMLLKATDRATGRQFNGVLLDHDRGHPAPPPERPMIAC